ncbi:MAG TPA: hypothetical protein VI434_08205 [Candidatus Dormibacteraeota bacterium]
MRATKSRALWGVFALAAVLPVAGMSGFAGSAQAASSTKHMNISCYNSAGLCTEVGNSEEVFGEDHYVGHDEPGVHFFSDTPGAGNEFQSQLKLPVNPPASNPNEPGKSYTFELNSGSWYGMTLCDTTSYPEQVSTCKPDSDSNILSPTISPKHVGGAFMELQFYPPGWIQWPTWQTAVGTGSCDPTKWCAALNIDSLLEDPVAGTTQNATCAGRVGVETINFAFLTLNGKSTGPANPIDSTLATFTPDAKRDLFMSPGDNLAVTVRDTPAGLQTIIKDKTSGQTGSMTASRANGFGHIQYDPTGTSCNVIPYAFHPMYSTSSEQTILPWAADQDNIAFVDEIGHAQLCHGPVPIPASQFGLDSSGNPITCPTGDEEGSGLDSQPTDGDDNFCFPGSEASVLHVGMCTDTNTGFDGQTYQPVWPDGNTALHPTSWQIGSPLTGSSYNVRYSRAVFEVDLPDIESTAAVDPCNRSTGANCTHFPLTDSGEPVAFYPFFSTVETSAGCRWQFGNHIPGSTNDFGQNAQYGSLLNANYILFGGGGVSVTRFNVFRKILSTNPC